MDGFDTKNAALLVIDMQHASLDPQGSLVKLLGVKENRMLRTIAPIQQLLAAFRAAGRPVFYNQMAVSAEYSDAGLLGRVFFPLKGLGHCVEDTWDFEIVDALKPLPGERVVRKKRWSGFYGTSLESDLRNLGITTLVVCGVATDVCVEATVRDAFYRDFACIVPREATASFDEVSEETGIRQLVFGCSRVVPIVDVLAALKG